MATTIRKLIVEVVEARSLLPKDGHGKSSPYVVLDYYGQRKRTHTAVSDLNPKWNEVLDFKVGSPSNVFRDMLEIDVYHARNYGPTTRNHFLGRIRLNSSQFVRKGEEALIYFPLERKSLFSTWVQGEIGLKIYYLDEIVPPPPPLQEPPEKAEEAKADAAAPPPELDSEQKQPPQGPASEAKPDESAPPQKEAEQAQPTAAAKNEESPPAEAAVSPENVPPDAEKMSKPEPTQQQPNQESANYDLVSPTLEPSSVINNPDGGDHIEIMPPTASKSVPKVKFSGIINGPQPIKGPVLNILEPTESLPIDRSSFDLVEKMHYLFVQIVKARSLPTNGNLVAKIAVGGQQVISKPARKTNMFEWDQTFAFAREAADQSSSIIEVSLWDPERGSDMALGGLCFDASEFPLRDPPDSPLAPQWYRLEGGTAPSGHLMLATWIGTQADEAFPDAWKTDTAGNNVNSRAKVYQSPKLWYLRATILEAQDIMVPSKTLREEAAFQIKAQLGFQVSKTKLSVIRNGTPSWNEDLLFVAAEPFSDHLIFSLEYRQPKAPVTIGITKIPLSDIERRVDDRLVNSSWFTLEYSDDKIIAYKGRLHVRLCFDGGYHVMDEAAHVCSDYLPTARQLWKPRVGMVELGIISCKNLLPMKAVNGKASTDAYCVAKYGSKWVRTRTISDCLNPKWNEQYTWKVYDPCTVLTIGVFDSWAVIEIDGSKEATRPDFHIGKVHVRISTLETGKVYRNTYPLLVLSNAGMKKMGEIEIAVRFVPSNPTFDFIHVYSQPLLPLMHHIKPLGVVHQEMLRNTSAKIVAAHLSRSEPPLRREVVLYMLDVDSCSFSMRKVRANWFRIINVIAGVIEIGQWVDATRSWKNPTATILVHALLVMLVWFPDLIVPTLAFYTFVIGLWNYRFRSRDPLSHFDPKISLVDSIDCDELDEEFDTLPSNRSPEVVRARYDKLRSLAARVQTLLGDVATQGERIQALVTWRDPRATGIFVGLCFVVAMVMYMVPSKMVAVAFGFYYLRHPIFRDRQPSPALNFFRRLPSLSDRIM